MRRIRFLDVIAFLACCWVAFCLMTQGRDIHALIDQFKQEDNVHSPD